MRRGPAELNPAQAFSQRMREMEIELFQARQALRRDRKRTSVSDRWGLGQTTESPQEEGWFLTYLDVMTLLLVAMVLVAASVSLRFFRFGGVTKLVVAGVTAGFVLYVATQLSEELGSSGIVNPVVAAWLPAALGTMLGALALLHQEDG